MKLIKIERKKITIFPVFLICLLLLVISIADANTPQLENISQSGTFPHTTLFTTVSGHPSSSVPSLPGTFFSRFNSIYGSPNGKWIAHVNLANSPDGPTALLVNGEIKLIQDQIPPWTGNTETISSFGSRLNINDAGRWAFSAGTFGPSDIDYFAIEVSPSDVYSVIVQETDPVPQIPGASWGSISPVMSNLGEFGWTGSLTGLLRGQDLAFVFDGDLLGQTGATIPPGQVNNNTWDSFGSFFVSADGNHWSVRGALKGPDAVDRVMVVDNFVVAQRGTVLPNSSYTEKIDAFHGSYMDSGGNWFVRGSNEDGHDWVYRNGAVIAENGTPIHPGTSEVFSDVALSVPFSVHVGDSFGNYVINGKTDNPDLTKNGVMVVNSEELIVRYGDPIDLDNDGIYDDDAYFEFIRDDKAFLDDTGKVYFIAYLMDGSDSRIGMGLFSYDISSVLPEPEIPIVFIPFVIKP